MQNTDHIIYFDGVCNLCHWAVKFVIARDKGNIFSFASLQSEYAEAHLLHTNGQHVNCTSVVYQDGEKIYTKSMAVFKILSALGGIWKLAIVFNVLPVSLMDRLYDFIASHRYSWFGKKNHCMAPSVTTESRFLN